MGETLHIKQNQDLNQESHWSFYQSTEKKISHIVVRLWFLKWKNEHTTKHLLFVEFIQKYFTHVSPSLSACFSIAISKADSSGIIPPHSKWISVMRQPAFKSIKSNKKK